MNKKTNRVPILVRLPKEDDEYLTRKTEQINKKRQKEPLTKPINKQDIIRELVKQDAQKKPGGCPSGCA